MCFISSQIIVLESPNIVLNLLLPGTLLNAFDFHLSNGFTEGCNNAIKALKRVAFGFRRFDSLRARALLAFNSYPNI